MKNRISPHVNFEPTEFQVEASFTDWLELQRGVIERRWPIFIHTHIANELPKKNGAITGARLKRLGKQRGIPDKMFIWANPMRGEVYFGFQEWKNKRGKPTKEQKIFGDKMLRAGVPYDVCYCLDDGVNSLKKWGVL